MSKKVIQILLIRATASWNCAFGECDYRAVVELVLNEGAEGLEESRLIAHATPVTVLVDDLLLSFTKINKNKAAILTKFTIKTVNAH